MKKKIIAPAVNQSSSRRIALNKAILMKKGSDFKAVLKKERKKYMIRIGRHSVFIPARDLNTVGAPRDEHSQLHSALLCMRDIERQQQNI